MIEESAWRAFKKLSLEERLVKIVQFMNRNAQNHVRVNGTFSYDFLVQEGLLQGSLLILFYAS